MAVGRMSFPIALEEHVALCPAEDLDKKRMVPVLEPTESFAIDIGFEVGLDDQRVTDLEFFGDDVVHDPVAGGADLQGPFLVAPAQRIEDELLEDVLAEQRYPQMLRKSLTHRGLARAGEAVHEDETPTTRSRARPVLPTERLARWFVVARGHVR